MILQLRDAARLAAAKAKRKLTEAAAAAAATTANAATSAAAPSSTATTDGVHDENAAPTTAAADGPEVPAPMEVSSWFFSERCSFRNICSHFHVLLPLSLHPIMELQFSCDLIVLIQSILLFIMFYPYSN